MSDYVPVTSLRQLCVFTVVKQVWASELVCRELVLRSAKVEDGWAAIVGRVMSVALQPLTFLPSCIKIELIQCIEGLASEIFNFYCALSPDGVLGVDETRFFLKHIMIKPSGDVDKSASLFSLLLHGWPFNFNTVTLAAKLWMDVEMLRDVVPFMCRTIALDTHWLHWYTREAVTSNRLGQHWPSMPVSLFRYTIWQDCADEAREYFYNAIDQSQRQMELAKALKLLLTEETLNNNGLEFIIGTLDTVRLTDIMLSHNFGPQLFKCLFISWRNRHVSVQLYVNLMHIMCPENMGDVLCCALQCMHRFKDRRLTGQYMDAKRAFFKIWAQSSVEVKSSETITEKSNHYFIRMICELEDFEMLSCVVNSDFKCNKTRIELCVTAILIMAQMGGGRVSRLIDECLQSISRIHYGTFEGILLTYNYISSYLIRMSESGDFSLVMYFAEPLINVTVLKQGLMNDKQFLLNVLKRCHDDIGDDHLKAQQLLNWALGNNTSLDDFCCFKLVSRGWYLDMYVMLMMNLQFTEATSLLRDLPLNVYRRTRAKDRLRGNMVLLHKILRRMIAKQIEGLEPFDKVASFLHCLFENEEDKYEFMQEFLLSDEAMEMFFGIIVSFRYAEEFLHMKYRAFRMYQDFNNIKHYWIQPYVPPAVLEARLREYGSVRKNTREEIPSLFKICCTHQQIFDNSGKDIVNLNFMCFRAVLLHDFCNPGVLTLMNKSNSVIELTRYFANAVTEAV